TTTTTYSVTETDINGCSNSNSATITVNALPLADAGSSSSICNGATANLGASSVAGSTYAWTSSPSGFTSTTANPTDNPTTTTTYSVTETDINGCSNTNSATITVNALPFADAGSSSAICNGS